MSMHSPKILGVAASLRNARWGAGNRSLIDQLAKVDNKEELIALLSRESELHLKNFLEAGRREGKQFLDIYRNLSKTNGEKGLSNSEIALAAALWAALNEGADIFHTSLSEYFSVYGEIRNAEQLKQMLLQADGIIISGPVYFGDRGSLAESLIDFIVRDQDLRAALAGRLYGGIAVGAKRNGGQETTLIYQMLDMLGLGMLAVGNDSETTSQYGGTGHAGDVGTMHKDLYGIDTSMGVGRRMAKILKMLGTREQLADVPRPLFLILQDVNGIARRTVDTLVSRLKSHMAPTILDLTSEQVRRCIACDICPTHIDLDREYRCIIRSDNDSLPEIHAHLLGHDLLVPVVATARDRTDVTSNYQTFIERSRYLRRGDYFWSDLLVAPITLAENSGYDTYAIRQMTSFLRHHTVMSQPLVGQIVDGSVIDIEKIAEGLGTALHAASRLTAGRLARSAGPEYRYTPVGYVLSVEKEAEDERMSRRSAMLDDRKNRLAMEAHRRLQREVTDQ
jgi:multimeric flavodoxin WrbA